MARDIPITQVMSRDVLTARTGDAVEDVVRLLAERDINGLPVVDDDGRLVGLLDDRDLLVADARVHIPTVVEILGAYVSIPGERRRFEEELRHALGRTVGELMNTKPPFVGEDATVEDVATLIVDRNVSRVPVVDSDQQVVGIVTRGDLIAAMGR